MERADAVDRIRERIAQGEEALHQERIKASLAARERWARLQLAVYADLDEDLHPFIRLEEQMACQPEVWLEIRPPSCTPICARYAWTCAERWERWDWTNESSLWAILPRIGAQPATWRYEASLEVALARAAALYTEQQQEPPTSVYDVVGPWGWLRNWFGSFMEGSSLWTV